MTKSVSSTNSLAVCMCVCVIHGHTTCTLKNKSAVVLCLLTHYIFTLLTIFCISHLIRPNLYW